MRVMATRNITIGGVLKVLQPVVVRQILYPTTFGNMSKKMLYTTQNKIQVVL